MPRNDLTSYIRTYDDDLDAPLCTRMIGSFESLAAHHQPNGRGHRAGLDASQWTEINVTRMADATFLGMFRHKVNVALARYNHDVPLHLAVPNSPKTADLILKRYRPGGSEQFQVHFDSIYDVAARYLVFLWYLNDGFEGGETEFPDLGVRIQPRRGRLLMFPPYWMFQHAGLPPRGGDKYILSTYLMF